MTSPLEESEAVEEAHAQMTAVGQRLDLEIEWFERLIAEDGPRGCDVTIYQSLLHKLRQVRGDIPSRPPSREEMDRFFADAWKHELHDRLRKQNDKMRAALQVIRDSNRHATFCTWSKARKGRPRTACSPGCPVLIAAEALRP